MRTSNKISRKQQEINERVEYWLNLAEEIISKKGYEEFQLVDLAELSGFSTGIVYKQFKTKEQITVMMAIRFFNNWRPSLMRSLAYEAAGRVRLFCLHIGLLMHSNLTPSAFRCIYIASTPQYKSKVPYELFKQYEECINEYLDAITKLVEISVESNEFVIPRGIPSARSVAVNLWAAHHGATTLRFSGLDSGLEVSETFTQYMRMVCDNMNWLPLSSDFDYDAYGEIARRDIFEEYYKLPALTALLEITPIIKIADEHPFEIVMEPNLQAAPESKST